MDFKFMDSLKSLRITEKSVVLLTKHGHCRYILQLSSVALVATTCRLWVNFPNWKLYHGFFYGIYSGYWEITTVFIYIKLK